MTGPASPAGLSPWWSTPARPGDHFTSEELRRSAELSRPIRRIRVGLVGAQVVLLIGSAAVLGWVGVDGPLESAGSTARALTAAAAVVLAVRSPEAVAARRVAALGTVEPVEVPSAGPVGGGLVGDGGGVGAVIAVLGPLVVLTVTARFLLGPLTDPATGWLVALAVTAAVSAGSVLATAARAGAAAEIDAPAPWEALAERAGLGGVRFGALEGPGVGAAAPNACAVAWPGGRSVLVDPTLLVDDTSAPGAPDGTVAVADLIVAHELIHLARRHPAVQLLLHAAVVAVALGALPALAAAGAIPAPFGIELDDPLSLPAAALVVVAAAGVARIPTAWVLRALERMADAGAVDLVGVPDREAVRVLHLRSGAELDPPWPSRLVAVRPGPAERLEYLARRRPVPGHRVVAIGPGGPEGGRPGRPAG